MSMCLGTDENVVDGDVNELDKEANETHDEETDTSSSEKFHKLSLVGLSALLDQVNRVLGELSKRLNEHFFESLLFRHG